MQLAELLGHLGYERSQNLLRKGDGKLESAPAYGHVFRLAVEERGLQAVYALRPPGNQGSEPPVPVVYICEASNEQEADETHRLVWNQDIAPFVIVNTPDSVRLYSGFRYRSRGGQREGLLQTLKDARQLLSLAETLGAEAIDTGAVWRHWGRHVHPECRVNWKLLESLKRLDESLQAGTQGLDPEVSHALIGKYVYLHYLKDRGILSGRKLKGWRIEEAEFFGREATLAGLQRVVERLDDWLNGGVFPIRFHGKDAPRQEHLQRVAATFKGDEPFGQTGWQLHLDFPAYDFSYIPIETLSVVYEQFLHMPGKNGVATKGKDAGAYYTPIPVVNFMLAEMEDRRPLTRGMRVLDPSCGSGAFLVQCYRRLIEKEYPPGNHAPGFIKLRELLQEHIFGVDRDADACSVTELSLILTLLDYVDPPDLENDRRVKLPSLRGENVFCADFFDTDSGFRKLVSRAKFDWVIGNPPWKKLNPKKLDDKDKLTWDWMQRAAKRQAPVGRNQVAQAFAWEAAACLSPEGQAGLLLPAMTLFEDHSRDFRASFLTKFQIQSVANFANLAEVLFAGRSRVPAAAIFFRPAENRTMEEGEYITAYSPLVANQELIRPTEEGTRQETWSLVLNASEVRDVPYSKVSTGSSLPWKLALWGSEFDERLLKRMCREFPTLGRLERDGLLIASEGLQLRIGSAGDEKVERVREVVGKKTLITEKLKELRQFFVFPLDASKRVPEELGFARVRGGIELPLSVCRPPHVIVSAARNFAIYSDEFLVVPPRQIGIISPEGNAELLKALSLFLASDFVLYHQFLTSTELGVKRPRATLNALRELPVPIGALQKKELSRWSRLHGKLVAAARRTHEPEGPSLWNQGASVADAHTESIAELNGLVFDALGLTRTERALVRDLVQVKFFLDDGKLGAAAVSPPNADDMKRYGRVLKAELDSFVEGELSSTHSVRVLYDTAWAMLEVRLNRGSGMRNGVELLAASSAESEGLKAVHTKLRRQWAQWVYFDRNLRIFEKDATYVFKPMQRFHWTASQALNDASDMIAETLATAGEEH